MKKHQVLLFTISLFGLLFCRNIHLSAATYTNPVVPVGADPAIVIYNDLYYCFTTNSSGRVLTSPDMINWSEGPVVIPEALRKCWAPEVYFHPEDGKYYMYYTKRYKIGVAVSNSPAEMFTDLGYIASPAIDAHMFRDDDKNLYLYFTVTPKFQIHCLPMKSPTEPSGPVSYLFQGYQDWELKTPPLHINEGPQMTKKDGKYLLHYCGNDGQTPHYSMGLAIGDSPLGPFHKIKENPVVAARPPEINAPAHGFVTYDRIGEPWFVYHQKPTTERGWKRDLCIDKMEYTHDYILGAFPTRGKEMPGPITDHDLTWAPEIFPRIKKFNQDILVEITSHSVEAKIYYTIDGSDPTTASTIYNGPFTLSHSATIKALAIKDGMRASVIKSQSYINDTEYHDPVFVRQELNALGVEPFAIWPKPIKDNKEFPGLFLQTNDTWLITNLRQELDASNVPYQFYENPYPKGDRFLIYIDWKDKEIFAPINKKWKNLAKERRNKKMAGEFYTETTVD